jgi:hypothetical protein
MAKALAVRWPRANASIPGMECLRSITPLAHLTLPSRALAPRSAQNRTHKVVRKTALPYG